MTNSLKSENPETIVVVTGAGSGIGQAVCNEYAKSDAKIVAVDVNAQAADSIANQIRGLGGDAIAVTADVSDPESVETIFRETTAAFGVPNTLVNSAGIRDISSFLDLSFEQWQQILNVNLNGVFLCSQKAARLMSEADIQGSITHVTSVGGLKALMNRPAYVA